MPAKLTELKTNRASEKQRMLAFLDFLRERIDEDAIENIVFIFDDSDMIQTEIIGDMSPCEVIGMISTANTALKVSLLES